MTMQAEQSSNHAAGRRNVPSPLSSPFTASLQAARKYLDRQRERDGQRDGQTDGQQRDGQQDPLLRADQGARADDDSLFRGSIFGGTSFNGAPGASIEAGLSFSMDDSGDDFDGPDFDGPEFGNVPFGRASFSRVPSGSVPLGHSRFGQPEFDAAGVSGAARDAAPTRPVSAGLDATGVTAHGTESFDALEFGPESPLEREAYDPAPAAARALGAVDRSSSDLDGRSFYYEAAGEDEAGSREQETIATAGEPDLAFDTATSGRLNSVGANRSGAPGGTLDPEAIRGAIFRLARDAERAQRPSLAEAPYPAAAPEGPTAKMTSGTDGPAAKGEQENLSLAETGLADYGLGDSEAMTFQDVARRVWGGPDRENEAVEENEEIEASGGISGWRSPVAAAAPAPVTVAAETATAQSATSQSEILSGAPRVPIQAASRSGDLANDTHLAAEDRSAPDRPGVTFPATDLSATNLPATYRSAHDRTAAASSATHRASMALDGPAPGHRDAAETAAAVSPVSTMESSALQASGRDHADAIPSSGSAASRGLVFGASQSNESRAEAAERRLAAPSVAEGSALAHDAGNLFSALGLYSELLCFSGVLHDRHRHYAEDLKLLASRSQVLINRLVRLVESAQADPGPVSHPGQASGAASIDAGEPAGSGCSEIGLAGSGAAANGRVKIQPGYMQDEIQLHEIQSDGRSAAGNSASPTVRSGDAPLALHDAPDVLSVADGNAGSAPSAGRASLEAEETRRLTLKAAPATRVAAAIVAQATGDRAEPNSSAPSGVADPASLVEVLMRSGSLLSTIAHGALKVQFGPQAALPVTADLESLERILVNLVCNATAAIREGGAIRVGVRLLGANRLRPAGQDGAAGQTMVLTVDDSGCGMSEAQIREVMRASGRATAETGPVATGTSETVAAETKISQATDRLDILQDATQAVGHGIVEVARQAAQTGRAPGDGRRHGLGMKIVCDLVAASGGELYIQSVPGKGTRVEIHWRTVARARPEVVAPAGAANVAGLEGLANSLPARPAAQMPEHRVRRPGTAAANGLEGAIAC